MAVVNWHTSPYDVYIGRHVPDGPAEVAAEDCVYGNPFVLNDVNDTAERAEVIDAYEKWLLSPEQASLVARARANLLGKILACWCKPKACHGDVLLWLVNATEGEVDARRKVLGLS
jgi:hypothetical protein